MSCGKYSPTVFVAYNMDQNWFNTYAQDNIYDPDGYDSYGYNINFKDRAGYSEEDYLFDVVDSDNIKMQWSFDGVKPTKTA